jgi:hypothetical protein
MPSQFDSRPELPDHLDPAQAEVYTETTPHLGGRWLVWTDDTGAGHTWWERPDGQYQPSMYKPESFSSPQWTKAS